MNCEQQLQTCKRQLQSNESDINSITHELEICQSTKPEFNLEKIRELEGMKERRDDVVRQFNQLYQQHNDLQEQHNELRNQYIQLYKQSKPTSRFVVSDFGKKRKSSKRKSSKRKSRTYSK
jgi:chromosome segregation ATPase